ncbi:nitrogenase molybdenum-iron protein subunit beta [Pararhodospirillum photometricum]|uniref:Nitrogenase molybdenum-iron protein beta chain n=1 Tax=Pararhodospirillum photometricum DSM 122 TaxID=1150469 RepID=H6SMS3_PARPM|nr:nitrogenase molybdenum-iron protein subunit beta [Pararhodospirillum photometricum]CCG09208.1 Nitrogenase molybdenum-iron protein beta chain [Pararhodospirillum photometricum DSM 122]
MVQSADKIKDHLPLFKEAEYQDMFARKRAEFENCHSDERIAEVAEWTKSWDYREKNLAREALVVNPQKACQPLGALFCAAGFDGTLGYVHGSQGCAAYFRSHLSRHFKEASSVVSDSMTEDAAVFGGLNNMIEGLANAYTLYKPKMIAVCTTCMAEVIGDDLQAFISNAKQKGSVPADFKVPYAHTPSFVGSHTTGYDNMMKGILQAFWEGQERVAGESVNIIPGFDGYSVANVRELKRIIKLMDANATILSDTSDVYDTPADGEFRMYAGGTTHEDTLAALNAKATISLSEGCTAQTLKYIEEKGQETVAFTYPMGLGATDDFLMALSRLTGKPIPTELEMERGRVVDAIADSMAWLHGKKFAVYGDPDFTLAMVRFLMELGAEPTHVLATNGGKKWEADMTALLATSPFGAESQVWAGRDLWHLRSILATEPADFLIGNSYGKYIEKDLGIPLIRLTFPIFDRHHHHRFPTMFYQGALRVLVSILDKIFDTMDASSDISFDLTR